MTIDAMRFLHPGKITICRANLRDDGGRVVTWHILRVIDTVDEARPVLARFDQDGICDAVAISPSEVLITADLAARFFRVYYGMQCAGECIKEVPPMALVPGQCERLLSVFKDEVCRNPDADFAPRIAELADRFSEQETKRFNGAFFMLLLELYEGNIPSLKRDLLKIQLLGKAKAPPSQRIAILQCVYGIIRLYIEDDFAGIIAICEKAEDACRMEDGSPELDTWGSLEPGAFGVFGDS